ncbi:hypothetical protein DK853_44480 [Klebsiella oxytoca]|nr:hypothetical protein DK853_44480 [Klebsiella oxytoca]
MCPLFLSLLLLKTFLLQMMMKVRMKILPLLLRILLHPLSFPDGSVLLGMQQGILPVILQISVVHVLSLNEPLLY